MKILLLGFAFVLPYHVLRCAAAAGHRVEMLGAGPARAIAGSRYCAGFHDTDCDYHIPDYRSLGEQIARLAASQGFDLVMPTDDVSTRALAAIRDLLPIPATPIPEVAAFDTLNDKWNFMRYAEAQEVRAPESRVYDDIAVLKRDLATGALPLPITVKPTNCSGGVGVVHLLDEHDLCRLDTLNYRPLLAQSHIRGDSVSVSALCEHGTLTAAIVQHRTNRHFRIIHNAELVASVARLVAPLNYNGPVNFDAVIESHSGRSYIVECNPRWWYSVFQAMIAGINFVALAIALAAGERIVDTSARAEQEINLYPVAFRNLLMPWHFAARDRAMIGYHLCDPLPFLRERLKCFDDSDVLVQQMEPYALEPAATEQAALFPPIDDPALLSA